MLLPQHFRLGLKEIVSGESLPPVRLTAPALVDLPNGPGSTLGCLKLALLLVSDARGRYVLLVQSPSEHQQTLQVEVAGLYISSYLKPLDGDFPNNSAGPWGFIEPCMR